MAALRESNQFLIVDALRQIGAGSRSDLVRLTRLSRATVTSLVADLVERDLVREERDRAPDSPRTGRPPAVLRLQPAVGAALAVAFGHDRITVALANLSGAVLAERTVSIDVPYTDASVALDRAYEIVVDVLAAAEVARGQLIGVGLGIPGPIDRRTGTIEPDLIMPAWAGAKPGLEFRRRIGLPVLVENDANLGALGERRFGAGRALSDFVYVFLSAGMGSALVLGGQLYRGATGVAGEIGHIQVSEDGLLCRCGNRGCLGPQADATALLALLRPTKGDDLDVEGMLRLISRGDPAALRVTGDAGRLIGRALADLCTHLNPAAIIVGGELSAAGRALLDGIREAIDRYALPAAAQAVELRCGELGDRADVLGALALVIDAVEQIPSSGFASLDVRRAGAGTANRWGMAAKV